MSQLENRNFTLIVLLNDDVITRPLRVRPLLEPNFSVERLADNYSELIKT